MILTQRFKMMIINKMYNRPSIFFMVIASLAVLSVTGYAYLISRTQTRTASYAKTDRQGGIVSGFPILPVYPGAITENSYKKSERNLVGFQGEWISNDRVSVVMAWYLNKLPASGWQLIEAPEFPETDSELFASFQKGKLKMNLIVEQESRDETEIHAEFPLQLP